MNIAQQSVLAEKFRALHDNFFVLPNAWDAMSAKIYESIGFKAIGTTSAGIAISNGYKDRAMPFETAIAAIKLIAQSVNEPVSADIEDGYGSYIEKVVESVKQVILAGAVGINLEDSTTDLENPLYDITLQQNKILAIKELALAMGIPFFINARTDVYWLNIGNPEWQLSETIKRAQAYHNAGADCLFIPGINNLTTIQIIRDAISCPINLLAGPDLPSLSVLSEIGIQRISLGSGPYRATASLLKTIGEEIMYQGSFRHMTTGVISYQDISKDIIPTNTNFREL